MADFAVSADCRKNGTNVAYNRETEAWMNRIPRAVYTKELHDEAVKLALTEGVGVWEASRRLSIPIKTLANCKHAINTVAKRVNAEVGETTG